MPLVKCEFDGEFSLNPHEKQLFFKKMSSTVVSLQIMGENSHIYAQGGGVLLRRGYVLTTSNLIQQGKRNSRIFIYTDKKKRYSATRFPAPAPQDKLLQLLKIDGDVDSFSFAEIASEQPREGFEMLFIGHSYKLDFTFTTGITCATRSVWELNLEKNEKVINLNSKRHENTAVVQLSKLCGGNSGEASVAEGCPLFNCLGEVVGLYGFCRKDFDFVLPATKAFVDQMLTGGKILDSTSEKSGSSKKRKRGRNF